MLRRESVSGGTRCCVVFGGVARKAYLHTSKQVVVTSLLGNKRKTPSSRPTTHNWLRLVFIYTHFAICFYLFLVLLLVESAGFVLIDLCVFVQG